MTAKQTKIVAFGSVIAVALVALAWFVGVSPQLSKANESKAATEQAVTATEGLRVNLASLQQKEAARGEAAREYADLARQFPASFEPSEWVSMVMSAASQSGVKLTTIAPSVPTLGSTATAVDPATGAAPATAPAPTDPAAAAAAAGDTLATSAVSITAEGNATALRDFLRRIGQMPRPILVENAALTGTETGLSTLTISGRTFLMRALEDPSAELGVESVDPDAPVLPEGYEGTGETTTDTTTDTATE